MKIPIETPSRIKPCQHEEAATSFTVREVLCLIWQADKYPIRGNEDWRVAAKLDEEALAKAAYAVPGPGDTLEFVQWLNVLQDKNSPDDMREEAMSALHDLFDPERAD